IGPVHDGHAAQPASDERPGSGPARAVGDEALPPEILEALLEGCDAPREGHQLIARRGIQALRHGGEEPARLPLESGQDLAALCLEIAERTLGSLERLPGKQPCSVAPQAADPALSGRLEPADGCPHLLHGETGRRIAHGDLLLLDDDGRILVICHGWFKQPGVGSYAPATGSYGPARPAMRGGGSRRNQGFRTPDGRCRNCWSKGRDSRCGEGGMWTEPDVRECKTPPRPLFG